jgi:hypothetical protein
MNGIFRTVLCFAVVILALNLGESAQTAAQKVPVMDGGAGPCSCELTIVTADGKPASSADVKVHIAYGFGGFHKLDLEAGANVDGKVNFVGLPARVRMPPLEFHASKNDLSGVATYDPQVECHAKHDITVLKSSDSPN